MSLRNNLITLLSKYFHKREEKPVKYSEWITSKYKNGDLYIGETTIEQNITDVTRTLVNNPQGLYGVVITLNKISASQTVTIEGVTIHQAPSINDNENYNYITFMYKSGTSTSNFTVILSEYYDENNNVLYEGGYWNLW